MKPYFPNLSVRILNRNSLESLLLAGTLGLSTEHLVHAGEVDKIREAYLSESGNSFYRLQNAPGIWSHGTLALSGRSLTVNEARPREDRPKSVDDESWSISTVDLTPPYKLYVGNLPYEISDTVLLKIFGKFGTVEESSIVTDSMSGRSKGFGFVQMRSESEARAAMQGLHDKEILNNGEFVTDYDSIDDTLLAHRKTVMSIIETASRELAKLICNEPGKLQDLEWRDLERLLATVFNGIGYAVQLTRSAKDGGKDLIIEFVASRQKQTYYVEVKHWTSGKKVGGETVREFLSVVVRDQPQGGIIISTSGFSASAMEGITEIERELRFGNSNTVVSLCRTYLKASSGLIYPVNYKDMLFSVTGDDVSLEGLS
jgi:hypothetical protein